MTNASRPTFLRGFGRAAAARHGPDLADMGTAFALDEALRRGSYDTHPPAETSPSARLPAPVAAWRRWLGRKRGA